MLKIHLLELMRVMEICFFPIYIFSVSLASFWNSVKFQFSVNSISEWFDKIVNTIRNTSLFLYGGCSMFIGFPMV